MSRCPFRQELAAERRAAAASAADASARSVRGDQLDALVRAGKELYISSGARAELDRFLKALAAVEVGCSAAGATGAPAPEPLPRENGLAGRSDAREVRGPSDPGDHPCGSGRTAARGSGEATRRHQAVPRSNRVGGTMNPDGARVRARP